MKTYDEARFTILWLEWIRTILPLAGGTIPLALGILLIVGTAVRAGLAQSAPKTLANPGESILNRITINDCLAPTDSQITEVGSAIADFQHLGNKHDEARALILLSALHEQAGEYKQAMPSLQRALTLVRSEEDQASEAQVLTMTADALTQLGQVDAAWHDATEALEISTRTGSLQAKASALRARAESMAVSQTDKAMLDLQTALQLSEQAGDLKTQVLILNDEGAITQDSSSPFDILQRALALEERIHDCHEETSTLTNLGTLEHDRGQLGNAFDHLNQAMALEQQVGDRTTQAITTHQLGYFHWEIGDLGEALSLFNQALQLERRIGDVASEGPTLADLAGVYRDTQWPATSLRAYQKALPLLQQTKNVQWQVQVLNNLGAIEADLHHTLQARNYYRRAVQLASSSDDPVTPAYSAWGVGELEQADALPSYFRSVQLAREFEQPNLEGEVYSSLMEHFRANDQPNVAIFFGKLAVDQFQSLRRNMSGSGNDLSSSFLQKKARAYRTLAETLVDQKRFIEAEQVLDLLKVQQYSDYAGIQPGELSQQLPRSAREAPLTAKFSELVTGCANLDKALREAKAAVHRQTPEVLQARTALRSAQTTLDTFLQSLSRQLEQQDGPAASVENVTGAELSLEKLIGSDSHTVALYTLEGSDHLSIIVITHAGRVAHSYQIAQNELDEKCQQFLRALRVRGGDSSSPAQELYGILIAPIENDLKAVNAKTLVWNLDGSLRYIPIGALLNKDTDRYVIEDYSLVNFTPLNHSIDAASKLEDATALGMGTSQIRVDGLDELSNVPAELKSIVADPDVTDSHGVLPGKILLNGEFTETAMQQELRSQAVVHIASHFVLKPGNDDLSFLLLGGKDHDDAGYRFSMAEFEKSDLHVEGTKLLTLSACETGASNERDVCFENNKSSVRTTECKAGEANQRESGVVMESISEVAFEKGVEAVISSLWGVDDMSTSQLMADFYQRWAGSKGAVSKAEALREAELDLLYGRGMAGANSGIRGLKVIEVEPSKQKLAGFSSPHYWAPFVLTGNWQ